MFTCYCPDKTYIVNNNDIGNNDHSYNHFGYYNQNKYLKFVYWTQESNATTNVYSCEITANSLAYNPGHVMGGAQTGLSHGTPRATSSSRTWMCGLRLLGSRLSMAKGDAAPPIRDPLDFFSWAESFRCSSWRSASSASSLLGSTGPEREGEDGR